MKISSGDDANKSEGSAQPKGQVNLSQEEIFAQDLQELKGALESQLKAQENNMKKFVRKMSQTLQKAASSGASSEKLNNMVSQFHSKIKGVLSKNEATLKSWISNTSTTRNIPESTVNSFLQEVGTSQKSSYDYHLERAVARLPGGGAGIGVSSGGATTSATGSAGSASGAAGTAPSGPASTPSSSKSPTSKKAAASSNLPSGPLAPPPNSNIPGSNPPINSWQQGFENHMGDNPKNNITGSNSSSGAGASKKSTNGLLNSLKKQYAKAENPFAYILEYLKQAHDSGESMGAIYQGVSNELSSGQPGSKSAVSQYNDLLDSEAAKKNPSIASALKHGKSHLVNNAGQGTASNVSAGSQTMHAERGMPGSGWKSTAGSSVFSQSGQGFTFDASGASSVLHPSASYSFGPPGIPIPAGKTHNFSFNLSTNPPLSQMTSAQLSTFLSSVNIQLKVTGTNGAKTADITLTPSEINLSTGNVTVNLGPTIDALITSCGSNPPTDMSLGTQVYNTIGPSGTQGALAQSVTFGPSTTSTNGDIDLSNWPSAVPEAKPTGSLLSDKQEVKAIFSGTSSASTIMKAMLQAFAGNTSALESALGSQQPQLITDFKTFIAARTTYKTAMGTTPKPSFATIKSDFESYRSSLDSVLGLFMADLKTLGPEIVPGMSTSDSHLMDIALQMFDYESNQAGSSLSIQDIFTGPVPEQQWDGSETWQSGMNLIPNGNFGGSDPTSGWSATHESGGTFTAGSKNVPFIGSNSVNMNCSSSTGASSYRTETQTLNLNNYPGLLSQIKGGNNSFVLNAYVKGTFTKDNEEGYNTTAPSIGVSNAKNGADDYSNVLEHGPSAEHAADSPTGQWQQVSFVFHIKPNPSNPPTISISLTCPKGAQASFADISIRPVPTDLNPPILSKNSDGIMAPNQNYYSWLQSRLPLPTFYETGVEAPPVHKGSWQSGDNLLNFPPSQEIGGTSSNTNKGQHWPTPNYPYYSGVGYNMANMNGGQGINLQAGKNNSITSMGMTALPPGGYTLKLTVYTTSTNCNPTIEVANGNKRAGSQSPFVSTNLEKLLGYQPQANHEYQVSIPLNLAEIKAVNEQGGAAASAGRVGTVPNTQDVIPKITIGSNNSNGSMYITNMNLTPSSSSQWGKLNAYNAYDDNPNNPDSPEGSIYGALKNKGEWTQNFNFGDPSSANNPWSKYFGISSFGNDIMNPALNPTETPQGLNMGAEVAEAKGSPSIETSGIQSYFSIPPGCPSSYTADFSYNQASQFLNTIALWTYGENQPSFNSGQRYSNPQGNDTVSELDYEMGIQGNNRTNGTQFRANAYDGPIQGGKNHISNPAVGMGTNIYSGKSVKIGMTVLPNKQPGYTSQELETMDGGKFKDLAGYSKPGDLLQGGVVWTVNGVPANILTSTQQNQNPDISSAVSQYIKFGMESPTWGPMGSPSASGGSKLNYPPIGSRASLTLHSMSVSIFKNPSAANGYANPPNGDYLNNLGNGGQQITAFSSEIAPTAMSERLQQVEFWAQAVNTYPGTVDNKNIPNSPVKVSANDKKLFAALQAELSSLIKSGGSIASLDAWADAEKSTSLFSSATEQGQNIFSEIAGGYLAKMGGTYHPTEAYDPSKPVMNNFQAGPSYLKMMWEYYAGDGGSSGFASYLNKPSTPWPPTAQAFAKTMSGVVTNLLEEYPDNPQQAMQVYQVQLIKQIWSDDPSTPASTGNPPITAGIFLTDPSLLTNQSFMSVLKGSAFFGNNEAANQIFDPESNPITKFGIECWNAQNAIPAPTAPATRPDKALFTALWTELKTNYGGNDNVTAFNQNTLTALQYAISKQSTVKVNGETFDFGTKFWTTVGGNGKSSLSTLEGYIKELEDPSSGGLSGEVAQCKAALASATGSNKTMYQDLLNELNNVSPQTVGAVKNWVQSTYGPDYYNLVLQMDEGMGKGTPPVTQAGINNFFSIVGMSSDTPTDISSNPVVAAQTAAYTYAIANNPSQSDLAFIQAYQKKIGEEGASWSTQANLKSWAASYNNNAGVPSDLQSEFTSWISGLPAGGSSLASQIAQLKQDMAGSSGEAKNLYTALLNELNKVQASGGGIGQVQAWAKTLTHGNLANLYIIYGQTLNPSDPGASAPAISNFATIIEEPNQNPGSASSIPAVNSFRNAFRFAKANQPLSAADTAFLQGYQAEFLKLGVSGATQSALKSWASTFSGGIPSNIGQTTFDSWISGLPTGSSGGSLASQIATCEADLKNIPAGYGGAKLLNALLTELKSVQSSGGDLADVQSWANTLTKGDFANLYIDFGPSISPLEPGASSPSINDFLSLIGESSKYPGSAGSIPAVNSFRNAYRFAKANQPLSAGDTAFLEAYQKEFQTLGAAGATQSALNSWASSYPGGIPANIGQSTFTSWISGLPAG